MTPQTIVLCLAVPIGLAATYIPLPAFVSRAESLMVRLIGLGLIVCSSVVIGLGGAQ